MTNVQIYIIILAPTEYNRLQQIYQILTVENMKQNKTQDGDAG